MKIYVASSWRNSLQNVVVNLLRAQGHEVYDFKNPGHGRNGFNWSEIDNNWQQWTSKQYMEALHHQIAEAAFKSDFEAMKWADCCVLVLPSGRSAHTEAGWMKGAGKKVIVLVPSQIEPELMYKVYDGVVNDMSELFARLKE